MMPRRYLEMINQIALAPNDRARGKVIDDSLEQLAADLYQRYPLMPSSVARTCAATFLTRLVTLANSAMTLMVERHSATVH